jgi:hypothetical protein
MEDKVHGWILINKLKGVMLHTLSLSYFRFHTPGGGF